MKTRFTHFISTLAALLIFIAIPVSKAQAQGTGFTYQGRLDQAGAPAHGQFDFEFRVFDALVDGTSVAGTVAAEGVGVSNGLFTVTLDFGPGVFDGRARWLDVSVRASGSDAPFAHIVPRHLLTPVPYAVYAGGAAASGVRGTLPAGALSGTYSGAVRFTNAASAFVGHGGGLTNLNASSLVGTVSEARLSPQVALLNRTVQMFSGPTNSFGGTVGVGSTNPQATLHLYSPATTLRLQSSAGFGPARMEFWSDPQGSANEWRPASIVSTDNGNYMGGLAFLVNGGGPTNRTAQIEAMRIVDGNIGIGTTRPVTRLHVSGEATMTACNITSDRNAKEAFKPVDVRAVLDKVARMPISEWQYKSQAEVRHIGPMAQDFHAAFAVGRDEKHITTVDADGVALAAIQGLNEKLEERLSQKDQEIELLKKNVAVLRELVNRLAPADAR